MNKKNRLTSSKGFTLVEILIALALVAILIPALVASFGFSIRSTSQGEKYSKAYGLAQEQIEAVYLMHKNGGLDWDWETTPANTSEGEYYQPFKSGDNWILGSKTTSPAEIDGFTKKVSIKPVSRNSGGFVSDDPGAVVDDRARMIIVSITWNDSGSVSEVVLESLVTGY